MTQTAAPYLVHNSQPEITSAIECWKDGENGRFEFCVQAAAVVGKYKEGGTIALANGILRSVSSVQNYAKVGQLWQAMNPQDAEHYRSEVLYSYWPPVARLWSNETISITGACHWFDEVITNKFTVEKFMSLLPTSEGKSVWKKSAKRWMTQAKEFAENDLINSPAFDVDPKQYKKVIRALKLTTKRIEDAIK